MPDLSQFTGIMDAIFLPLIGGGTLMFTKFAQGDAARWAERQFLTVLVITTLVTLRTVITCDDVWLVHTITLATMIVGALVIANQDDASSIVVEGR